MAPLLVLGVTDMGAAGNVDIYDAEKVYHHYEELWGDLGYDITKDWWYPDWDLTSTRHARPVAVVLDGRAYLLDYADDQGDHEGTGNSFWFDSCAPHEAEEQWAEFDARIPEDEQPWQVRNMGRADFWGASPAQARVLTALNRAGVEATVEVWT